MPDTEIKSCSTRSMQNRLSLDTPEVALGVMATDFLPAAHRDGQGCMGSWDGVQGGCEGLLTQGPASKDKCFSGSTVKNILHSPVLSVAETLDIFPPSLFPHHPSILVPFRSLSLAMSAA